MLLRLVPEPPLPTILFTLAFGNLPDGVPFPSAWTAQLQHILHNELEMPQCIHALDKAAWAVCLLHEVTFSVAAQSVSVLFVDGTNAEWPLEDEKLEKALRDVMDDVSESSVASEMEQRRAQAIQIAAEAQASQERMPAAPSPTPGKGKHKKSRSLLMSLVASFCPSHSPPAPLPLPLTPSRPLAPPDLAPPPPEPPQSSRHLRRKARAALVDIYRRYILPTLVVDSPFTVCMSGAEGGPGGGYVLWNLHSILGRIEGRKQVLGAELVSSSPSIKSSSSNANAGRLRTSPSALSECPFDEEEETSSASGTAEESSESAETEASSVSIHTPRDVLPAYPALCAATGQEEENGTIEREGGIVNPVSSLASPFASVPSHLQSRSRPQSKRLSKRPPHLPQNQQCALTPQQQAQQHEYALLHASTIRLRALISRASSFAQAQAEDRSATLVALEKKSRRRAWSCKQLMGGARVDVGLKEGLNVPTKGSGLRWSCVISFEGENIQTHGRHMPRRREVGTQEPKQVQLPGPRSIPVLTPAFVVPSQAGCIPFPQTESIDDFCSTGPQDTSRLFGAGEESENEDSDSVDSDVFSQRNAGGLASYPRSHSSDDLPSLLSSLSTSTSSFSSPSPVFSGYAYELEDAELDRPPPMHTFKDGDAFEPPCDALASALCFEETCKCRETISVANGIGRGRGLMTHVRRNPLSFVR